jgi:hypothetical protein
MLNGGYAQHIADSVSVDIRYHRVVINGIKPPPGAEWYAPSNFLKTPPPGHERVYIGRTQVPLHSFCGCMRCRFLTLVQLRRRW